MLLAIGDKDIGFQQGMIEICEISATT